MDARGGVGIAGNGSPLSEDDGDVAGVLGMNGFASFSPRNPMATDCSMKTCSILVSGGGGGNEHKQGET